MSEPDRFDAQARELARQLFGGWPVTAETIAKIAAALRAAESSALELAIEATRDAIEEWDGKHRVGNIYVVVWEAIRALIQPAAAPAADLRDGYERGLSMPIDGGKQALDRVDAVLAKHAPAAETGKAQEAEALLSIRSRITEYLAHGGLLSPDLMDHDAVSRLLQDARAAIDVALSARATPPEGEGT